MELFPLARFSSSISKALGEDRDTRATQNIFSIFQLQQLRAVYGLLQEQIAGLGLMLPIVFAGEDKSNCVLWIGGHDPYDLYQMILVHATTAWTDQDRSLSVSVKWENPDMLGCHCSYDERLMRRLMKMISPELFNEIFRSFFKSLGVYTYCPAKDKANEHEHPKECELCKNEGMVRLHKTFGEKFRPSRWLETITGIYGYDRQR